MYKFALSLLWPYPTTPDHYLNKRDSTLPENASLKVTAFLTIWFFRNFLEFLSLYSPILKRKLASHSDLTLSRDHDSNKFEFLVLEDASIQFLAFLIKRSLKRRFFKNTKNVKNKITDGRMLAKKWSEKLT